ncbi:hypothetical protein Efla_002887 [Eimeria flavescens]
MCVCVASLVREALRMCVRATGPPVKSPSFRPLRLRSVDASLGASALGRLVLTPQGPAWTFESFKASLQVLAARTPGVPWGAAPGLVALCVYGPELCLFSVFAGHYQARLRMVREPEGWSSTRSVSPSEPASLSG